MQYTSNDFKRTNIFRIYSFDQIHVLSIYQKEFRLYGSKTAPINLCSTQDILQYYFDRFLGSIDRIKSKMSILYSARSF